MVLYVPQGGGGVMPPHTRLTILLAETGPHPAMPEGVDHRLNIEFDL
jgi:hypothetical protein